MKRFKVALVVVITSVWFAHFYGIIRHGVALRRYYRAAEVCSLPYSPVHRPREWDFIPFDAPLWWRVEGAALALSAWGIAAMIPRKRPPGVSSGGRL